MGALNNLVIAVTGTLEHDVSKIKKWVEANGGRYSPNIRRGVTHLITGKDAWKKATDTVQAANKLGIFVVNFEWLEDSLHRKRKLAEKQYTWENITQHKRRSRELKKLGPGATTVQFNEGCKEIMRGTGSGMSKSRRPRVVVRKPRKSTSVLTADMHVPYVSAAEDLARRREERAAAKAKKEQKAAAKNTKDAKTDRAASTAPSMAQSSTLTADNVFCPASASSHALSTTSFQPTPPSPSVPAKKPALKDLYHYYLDTTGFEFKIILARCNLHANEIARYRLSILESHTKPHVYCTFVEYFPPGVGNTAGSSEACIQALLDFDKTFHENATPGEDIGASFNEEEDKTNAQLPLPQQSIDHHPEAERLRTLLRAPTASLSPSTTNQPFKALIAPMSSPFTTAWRTFRHTFRDLTLLSWEERFDISKALYKTRAAHFAIEPFVYMRPKLGLPTGLLAQHLGLFQNQTLAPVAEDGSIAAPKACETREMKYNDDNYVYNAFNLPALQTPLGSGIIGQAVSRDVKSAREAAAAAAAVHVSKSVQPQKIDRKKPNFSRPLFNGVNGRPTTDAWGRRKSGEGGAGGVGGSGLFGGGVVRQIRGSQNAWPYETGRL